MSEFFGTDGVRGIAYSELTVQMAEALGQAAVSILGPRLLIGRDTRTSGSALQQGLVAGITAAGGKALLAGVIPTPAVALLVQEYAADGGVVISASHNTPEYNGIKFFGSLGYKLEASEEERFEAVLQAMPALDQSVISQVETPNEEELDDAPERYIAHSVSVLANQGFDLTGMKIVIDCAHGAACYTSPEALRRLGAEVITIHTEAQGDLINVNCGSTDLRDLIKTVLECSADIGIAHDGDADRMQAVSAQGKEVDGDYIKAICARMYKEQGRLVNDTVVSTVMANVGFVNAMNEIGIEVIQTDVGDSKVLSKMLEEGYVLGGEQSGHILFLEHNTTGDGLVSALQLLAAMRYFNQPLDELMKIMKQHPQDTKSLNVTNKAEIMASESLAHLVKTIETELGSEGKVLLRASGTEPKIRITVWAPDQAMVAHQIQRLADQVIKLDQS